MTLFLNYFDGGPLDVLAGHRGKGMVFVHSPGRVSFRGEELTTDALAINHQIEGNRFRFALDAFLHRELFRFLAMRQAAGWTPHLVFHWERTARDDIEVTDVIETSVNSPFDVFALLHNVSNDVLLRLTVMNPPELSSRELLEERLAEGDCPWFDGITYADGSIFLVHHKKDPEPRYLPSIWPLVRSSIESFWEHNVNQWLSTTLLDPTVCEAAGVSLSCGVGPEHGGEEIGLLIVRGLDDGKVRWAAHFEDSGAFTEAGVIDGEVVVTAARTKVRWRFPLARPERVRVEWA